MAVKSKLLFTGSFNQCFKEHQDPLTYPVK